MAVKDNIERFAAEQGWVVKYAADGTPNFFYPIPKMKSSDLDPSLPDHTHPAFIVNNQEIDRRLIAVYKGGQLQRRLPLYPERPAAGQSRRRSASGKDQGVRHGLRSEDRCGQRSASAACPQTGLHQRQGQQQLRRGLPRRHEVGSEQERLRWRQARISGSGVHRAGGAYHGA